MPERQPDFYIVDILIAIEKIKRRSKALSYEAFLANEIVQKRINSLFG